MSAFPRIDDIRRQLESTSYQPLTDAELAELRRRDAAAVQNHRIEGIEFDAEDTALFALLLELRVPQALGDRIIEEYCARVAREGQPAAAQAARR